MFRLKEQGLPADPTYPADLQKLGYYVDPITDEIRNLEHPTDYYRYNLTKNPRHNDVAREAFHLCIRREVLSRLDSLHVRPFYLPHLSTKPPTSHDPHLAILCTPPEQLRSKKRIILINNSSEEDLAIWSYRVAGRAGGISAGSAVSLVQDIVDRATRIAREADPPREPETPGFIILNPGQLLYSHRLRSSLSHNSWDALPRASAVSDPTHVDEVLNKVEGNRDPAEHIEFVLKHVLSNERFVRQQGVNIYAIGIRDGAVALAEGLETYWSTFSTRIVCLAMTACNPIRSKKPAINTFLHHRARLWAASDYPLQTAISNGDPLDVEREPYPTVSGGGDNYLDKVFPTCFRYILDWFEEVFHDGLNYENGTLEISDQVMEDLAQAERDAVGPDWGPGSPAEEDAQDGEAEADKGVNVDVDANGRVEVGAAALEA